MVVLSRRRCIVCPSLALHGFLTLWADRNLSQSEATVSRFVIAQTNRRLVGHNMFGNEKDEVHWDLQVEPLEDQDVTGYDVDPSMKIWQGVAKSGPEGKYQMAEGDLDELHQQPPMEEVVPVVQGIPEAAPDTAVWNVPGADEEELHYKAVRGYLASLVGNIGGSRFEPETDMDDLYHADLPLAVQVEVQAPAGSDVMSPPGVRLHSEPEEDLDDLYHADLPLAVQMEVQAPAGSDVMSPPGVRLHSEPEEDLDDLYHADLPPAVQVEVQAPAGSDIRERMAGRMHLEPEEDLDDLYHRDQLVPVGPYQGLTRTPGGGQLSSDQATQRKRSEPEEDMDDLYHQ
ncbi:unnamed protein product [Lota lota]